MYVNCDEFSTSIGSSVTQDLKESPYMDGGKTRSKPLNFLLQNDQAMQETDISRNKYKSTDFRILNHEQELMSLEKSFQLHGLSMETEQISAKTQNLRVLSLEGRLLSRKRNPLRQVTSCIASINFLPRGDMLIIS
ncbi:hypothetical protein Nepgr_012836 [Nepenthes gracilis]|uniref:Uncharacterized protein n=1 Tax=Nepenthes gracilis TaxID=150966 RepID=A0AAD3XNQ7_NEPGR|nr:hypothetical protein Nepgr_012836 [Nepenthes gracilis]